MSWTDPAAAIALFETGDIFGASNFKTYVLDNLLSMPHPLEAPTTAALDINTTTAETTLYSVTVPGNAMGANGMVEMLLYGDYLHNNAGPDYITVRIKHGGFTLYADSTQFAVVTSANRQPWIMKIFLANMGATNVQRLFGHWAAPAANTSPPTTGIGDLESTNAAITPIACASAGAVDTTSNQTLLISVQWSASSANLSFRRFWARTLIAQN